MVIQLLKAHDGYKAGDIIDGHPDAVILARQWLVAKEVKGDKAKGAIKHGGGKQQEAKKESKEKKAK